MKFIEGDFSVVVGVDFLNHFNEFFITDNSSVSGKNFLEILDSDFVMVVGVEEFKKLPEFLLSKDESGV